MALTESYVQKFDQLESNGYQMLNDFIFSEKLVQVYITKDDVEICNMRGESKTDTYGDMQALADKLQSEAIDFAWKHHGQ